MSGIKSVKLSILRHRLLSPMVVEPDSTSRKVFEECRLRNLTYSGPLYVDLKCEIHEDDKSCEKVLNDVYIGRIPIMIYSRLCHVKDKKSRMRDE